MLFDKSSVAIRAVILSGYKSKHVSNMFGSALRKKPRHYGKKSLDIIEKKPLGLARIEPNSDR